MADNLTLTVEYKGYTISWDSLSFWKGWCVELEGELERQGFTSPDKAQEWIDAQTKKKFKWVNVLLQDGWGAGERFLPGVATSSDEDGRQAWVTRQDGLRGKWGIGYLCLDTPANQAIVEKLKGLNEEIKIIEESKDSLKAQLAKLTPEMMVKHD